MERCDGTPQRPSGLCPHGRVRQFHRCRPNAWHLGIGRRQERRQARTGPRRAAAAAQHAPCRPDRRGQAVQRAGAAHPRRHRRCRGDAVADAGNAAWAAARVDADRDLSPAVAGAVGVHGALSRNRTRHRLQRSHRRPHRRRRRHRNPQRRAAGFAPGGAAACALPAAVVRGTFLSRAARHTRADRTIS